MFLLGLQKLGKGDWRGISRSFVVSRTPTQVASNSQKYFIRQTNATRRKRRSSLFDMVTETPPVAGIYSKAMSSYMFRMMLWKRTRAAGGGPVLGDWGSHNSDYE
ncbi:hypothetical protein POM88_031882 [Heracleum sosnowskyi]|uniref:HTH myb-type domain-containing protein n=1 Tax=Heracleum sosnowskyi TaxID=360622 RepID=A0AAD8HZG9_9APIA|nr:hypothetical protein POM88_031882 [Heracleum sosnowskyi]